MMQISESGIKAIEGYEGCRLMAYPDSVGVWTIGVGHILGVKPGDVITQEQADQFLQDDLANVVFDVNTWVDVPLAQGEFDALCSFVFNLGGAAFRGSTLLKLLNAGNYQGAADQFPLWNHAGGVVLPGLTARRAAERAMFLGSTEVVSPALGDTPPLDNWGNEART